MSEAFGYYLFVPAFFWFLIILTALAFLCFGLAMGWTMGRNSDQVGAHRVPEIPQRIPSHWPGGDQ